MGKVSFCIQNWTFAVMWAILCAVILNNLDVCEGSLTLYTSTSCVNMCEQARWCVRPGC